MASPVVNFCDEENLLKDEVQLLRIFPEEIWCMLLEKIEEDSNDDLLNTVNASLYFRNLLYRKRVQFLFPKVWRILGMKYEEAREEEEEEGVSIEPLGPNDNRGDRREEGTEEGEVDQVDVDDEENRTLYHRVLKLRLVCRRWRDAIDDFYQNLPQFYKMKYDLDPKDGDHRRSNPLGEVGSWARLSDFTPGNIEYLREFLEHFESSHPGGADGGRNPVLTRAIDYLEYGFDDHEFLDLLFRFLTKYGHHIWYCKVTTHDDFPSRAAYYSKLQEILQLLPNLKVLDIQYFWSVNWRTAANFRFRGAPRPPPIPEELSQLQSEIDLNPVPEMENLQFLKSKNLLSSVFNELIRSSENLAMLEVSRGRSHEDYDIWTRPLPKLKQVSMKLYSEADLMRMGSPEVSWRLKKLYFSFSSRCPFIPWSTVFSLLADKYGESLTNVIVALPRTEDESEETKILEESLSLRLDLPRVKRLKLYLNNWTSFDFLLPVKDSLENLTLTILCDFGQLERKYKELADTVKDGQVIRLFDEYRHGKMVQECNVWTLFPKLEALNVCEDYSTCTGRAFRNRSGHDRATIIRRFTRKQWQKEMEKRSGI